MTAFDLSLPDSVPDDRYRRGIGLLLGALLGLTYGLVSQVGNWLMLLDVPLYQPPLGALGNTFLFTAAGALLGVLVAWPRSGIKGAFLMAAAGAIGIVVFLLATAPGLVQSLAFRVVTAITLALPFWGMLVVIFAALRWVIGHQEEAHRDRQSWRGRVLGPLVLVAVVAFTGWTSVYPPRGRDVMRQANAMLSEAARTGSTPAALAKIPEFPAHGASGYRLEWQGSNVGNYRIPRPSRNFDLHSVAVARYADGWNLVCVYIAAAEPPICRGFAALPQ